MAGFTSVEIPMCWAIRCPMCGTVLDLHNSVGPWCPHVIFCFMESFLEDFSEWRVFQPGEIPDTNMDNFGDWVAMNSEVDIGPFVDAWWEDRDKSEKFQSRTRLGQYLAKHIRNKSLLILEAYGPDGEPHTYGILMKNPPGYDTEDEDK